MIVTLTANPSIDRTITLSEPLSRGSVMRSVSTHDDAGGKGVNVAQVIRRSGQPAVAVLPGDHDDPLLIRLREMRLTHRAVPTGTPARINLTLAESDGTTTKINASGAELAEGQREALIDAVLRETPEARWAVLSGSLPPGTPATWYAEVIAQVAGDGLLIALDTSGEPLREAVRREPHSIDLIKPNEDELADLVGVDATTLTSVDAVVAAATPLVDAGIGAVLVTMGSAGAVLVTGSGVWVATAPQIRARSTVGAGDSALAGYVLGALDGLGPDKRLGLAVAYGSAAASLPGSTMPGPSDLPPLPEARPWNKG